MVTVSLSKQLEMLLGCKSLRDDDDQLHSPFLGIRVTDIVTCYCGAQIRVSQHIDGRGLCCPKCKSPITHGSEGIWMPSRRAASLDVGVTCPICQTAVADADNVLTCQSCDQIHHAECWTEVGGCGTYGCRQAPQIDKEDATAVGQPLSAWGDTKRCPACGEAIKAIALKCRYCQTPFDTVDPLTMRDLRLQVKKTGDTRTLRSQLITLFAASFIGFLAPITLIVGLAYVLPNRKKITAIGPIYLVMGLVSIALSAIFCFVILLFILLASLR